MMASGVLYQQRGQLGEQEEGSRYLYAELVQTLGAKGDLLSEVSNIESMNEAACRSEVLAELGVARTRAEAMAGLQSIQQETATYVGATRDEAQQPLTEQRRRYIEESRKEQEQSEMKTRLTVQAAGKQAHHHIGEARREAEAI